MAGRRAFLALLAGLPALLAPPALAEAELSAARRLAPGVYVFAGAAEAPDAANRGRVANVGVIIGAGGVIVVGTGGSAADGERLLAAIRRLSRKPVVLAIDTYAGPEHVLGNSAFARRGIPILAHRETDRYMVQNCAACIRNQKGLVGAGPLAGSHLTRPRRLIDAAATLVAGGHRLELLYFGPTQQPGSIAVFDPDSGVLFAGGLASFDVLPDAHDADLAAWLEALAQMRRLPLGQVVPGRGPVGDPGRLDEVRDYLADLGRETEDAYRRGLSLFEATAAVELPRYRDWAMYSQAHRRNVHFQYLRLEARDFADPAPTSR